MGHVLLSRLYTACLNASFASGPPSAGYVKDFKALSFSQTEHVPGADLRPALVHRTRKRWVQVKFWGTRLGLRKRPIPCDVPLRISNHEEGPMIKVPSARALSEAGGKFARASGRGLSRVQNFIKDA